MFHPNRGLVHHITEVFILNKKDVVSYSDKVCLFQEGEGGGARRGQPPARAHRSPCNAFQNALGRGSGGKDFAWIQSIPQYDDPGGGRTWRYVHLEPLNSKTQGYISSQLIYFFLPSFGLNYVKPKKILFLFWNIPGCCFRPASAENVH